MVADENTNAAGNHERCEARLTRFLTSSAAAVAAAGSLRDGAEVAIRFTDEEGDWRFHASGGRPMIEAGHARDPDFALRLSAGAVTAICARDDASLGELGVAFFEHVVTREPDRRIQIGRASCRERVLELV